MSNAPLATGSLLPEGSPPNRRQLRILLTGWTLRWFGVSFYVPYLLLFLHSHLRLDFAACGLLLGGVSALAPPLSLVGGGLADHVGRRRTILVSLSGEAAALAALAFGLSLESLPVILAGLIGSQICSSLGVPSTVAYVGDVTAGTARTRAIAWIRIGINLGYSGGIAVGGVLLLSLAFWEMTALAALVVGTAAALGVLLLAPSSRDRALFTASTDGAPSAPPALGTTFRGAVRAVRGSVRAIRSHPILFELGVASGLSYLMFQQLNYSISTFGLGPLSISYGLLGAALATNGITCVLLPMYLPRLLVGRSHTWVGAWGAGVIGIALFAFGLDGAIRLAVVPVFFGAVFTMSVGECFATIPPHTLALNMAPEAERGRFAGAISMTTGIVASMSAIFAGIVLGFGGGPLVTWAVLAAPSIPSVLLFRHLGIAVARDHNRI